MLKLAIPLLHVSNPAAAEKFYCDKLGFQKTFAYRPFGEPGPCYFGLERDGIRIHLSSFPEDGKPGSAIVLITENVDALFKEFTLKNTIIDLAPTDQSWETEKCILKILMRTVFVLLNGQMKKPK